MKHRILILLLSNKLIEIFSIRNHFVSMILRSLHLYCKTYNKMSNYTKCQIYTD